MNKLTLSTLLLCGVILSASAQKKFKYKAALHKIDSTGFYRIGLQPGLVAKAKPDLSDIRIADAKGNFVPYIQAGSLPQKSQKSFVVFPEISNTPKTDTSTVFIIENKTGLVLDRLWIRLQNTAVKRKVNLLGSDDLKQWFAIQEEITLQEAVQNSEGTYLQSLSFPASNYRYLKIQVNDKNKNPVKFLEAGIYTEYASTAQSYTLVAPLNIIRADSNKTTFIDIKLNDNYQINKLHLNIRAPRYYKRSVTVYQFVNNGRELLSEAELSSDKTTDLLIAAKANHLLIEISNGDNQPLSIGEIKAFQSDEYLISYLEAKQSYQFLVGDPSAQVPEYDLKFFADSVGWNAPVIKHEAVVKNTGYAVAVKPAGKDYTGLIWVAIIVSLGLLLLLTLKMTREVKKKEEER
ncbi:MULTISPECIES: hypothetical protein [Mucilaginibacter]|nr:MULTISPECIES: hypothetical protein [Mucilaginibacter]QTE43514.1 hypothetical protein J3L19_32115 [Mucilaginibacter rubeus]QTE50114.1 hypothetical protein J3L21_32070 [Mucilaginibacter rubeus]QTE55203.1 hypothetical protein J3L23_23690 [Mucilaginibacter rubeus]QTE65339.1 hypothetical protein J3L22_10135 [Mucilaginibacter rubeus]QTF64091.1 hypothetical protein J3L20_09810 [Mucilaginibacter rubeus]